MFAESKFPFAHSQFPFAQTVGRPKRKSERLREGEMCVHSLVSDETFSVFYTLLRSPAPLFPWSHLCR
jgi:hypothetical protein